LFFRDGIPANPSPSQLALALTQISSERAAAASASRRMGSRVAGTWRRLADLAPVPGTVALCALQQGAALRGQSATGPCAFLPPRRARSICWLPPWLQKLRLAGGLVPSCRPELQAVMRGFFFLFLF